MSGAVNLVGASVKQMGKMTGSGLAGLGRGGAVALAKGFSDAGVVVKAGLGAALAGGATVLGVGVKAVNSAAGFEQRKVAFTTLIGDAGKAEQTLSRLRKYANETPFEFPEVADAARQLIAFGVSSDDVVGTLSRLGDVSAGVQAPIGEIAELFGKIKVGGRMTGEEIRQFTHHGIPIFAELARQFGVSESQVRKLVESGKVGFPDVEKAIVSMTSKGGKFFQMTEKQSKTTKGLFTTLSDSFGDVMRTLGEPINDAIRPLIAGAIDLVGKLTPLATEAGKRIKDAIELVIAAFKSGQLLELVTRTLKLGFAVGVNALINGLRIAVEFFWNLISDGTMWKSLGTVLLGIAAGFGAAMLDAFQTPILYLQAGMEWVVANLIKGLLQIPGMDELLGFDQNSVDTDFAKILKERKETGADLFGFNINELKQQATDLVSAGAPVLGDLVSAAATKAAATSAPDLINTTDLQQGFDQIVDSIRAIMPKAEEVKKVAEASGTTTAQPVTPEEAMKLIPVVTALGKVGGGGYVTGTLDAQRENNRLTGETNRLLTDLNRRVDKIGGGTARATFG